MVTKSPEFPTELPAGEYQMAVFENLFPSLSMNAGEVAAPNLSVPTRPATGVCEVVVFSQDPETSLGNMSIDEVTLVLEVIADRTKEIGERPEIKYVLPFENRGVEVGVTLHHPHGQIYAYPFVPSLPQRMVDNQAAYFAEHGRGLLKDMLAEEEKDMRRMIVSGDHAAAFIPVCARYPYETWIMPRRPVRYLYELDSTEIRELATTLKTLLMKYDALWNKPFPYLLALFQAPTDGAKHEGVHAHFQTFPPLRTADKLKFLAGTELAAGMFVNDSQPEEKAAELREAKPKGPVA